MQKLIIMGAGGLARELANAVAELNATVPSFDVLGFLDDLGTLHGQKQLQLPVLGPIDQLPQHKSENLCAMPAVGDGYLREKFAQVAQQHAIALPTIIHPSSIVGQETSVQEGVFIAAGCVITVNANLGKCTLVNMGCTVAHDVKLGDYVSAHPGARISGQVVVKDYTTIGTQAVILNGCTIGQGALVAMGAVVAHDVPDYTLVAGNPARVVKKLPKPSNP